MKKTKSKKTQYSGEITMIEFLKANSDLTTREIATALGRGMSSVNGQLRQLHGAGQIVQSGLRNGAALWRFNNMPFGSCSGALKCPFDHYRVQHSYWAGGKNKARRTLEQKWAEAVNKNEVKNG